MGDWNADPADVRDPYAPDCGSRAAEGFYVGALYGAFHVVDSTVLDVQFVALHLFVTRFVLSRKYSWYDSVPQTSGSLKRLAGTILLYVAFRRRTVKEMAAFFGVDQQH